MYEVSGSEVPTVGIDLNYRKTQVGLMSAEEPCGFMLTLKLLTIFLYIVGA